MCKDPSSSTLIPKTGLNILVVGAVINEVSAVPDKPHRFVWGVFNFTFTVKKASCGLQVESPFHRHDARYMCRRFVMIPSARECDSATHVRALRLLKYWCSQATDYDRKWKHITWYSSDADVPAPVVLDSLRIDIFPDPATVLTDQELDDLDDIAAGGAAEPVAPPPDAPEGDVDDAVDGPLGRGARGRGRGRKGARGGRHAAAKAGAAGKAKAKAKAKAAPLALDDDDRPDGDDSSPSPSSSSSSPDSSSRNSSESD